MTRRQKAAQVQPALFGGPAGAAARGSRIYDDSTLGGLFDRTEEAPRAEPVKAAYVPMFPETGEEEWKP